MLLKELNDREPKWLDIANEGERKHIKDALAFLCLLLHSGVRNSHKNILLLYLGRNIAVNIAQFHNFSKVYVRIITVLNNPSL